MPLTLLLGALTLTPAVVALLIAALGLAKRALPALVFGLAAIGVLVPAISLLVLAPYLASGDPLRATLFGGVTGPTAWLSPVYRADALSLYAGLGLTFLVAPVLVWLAWKGPTAAVAEIQGDGDERAAPTASAVTGLARPVWGSVALALGVEAAAMTVLFSDNILWLALSWVVLAALAWGLGEIGAGGDTVDRVGIAFMLAGPVLWAAMMMTGAGPAKAPTLYDLMGRGSFTVVEVILLALTLALAGGAYPFVIWMRRRAVLATPAGVGVVLLTLAPVVLYVGARTYSAAQDAASAWPAIGKAVPPITAGIAFAVLGAVTIGVTGLMALERRDTRSTLALLAAAQVGWGFLALGTGEPGGMLGLTVLLATAVFGLGAMVCAAFAAGTLGDEEERDGAGPRPFGAMGRPANLVAWCGGAVALIGAPLFAGFAARHIITAAALQLGNLTIPLVGLAWAGDGLLALALLRLTAPAFTSAMGRSKAEVQAETLAVEIEDVAVEVGSASAGDAADEVEVDDLDELDESSEDEPAAVATATSDLRELPGVVFAALALVVGIAPQLLLSFGGALAAGDLAQAHAVDGAVHTLGLGYTTGPGQWLASLAWLALVALVVVVAVALRPGGERTVKPALLDGQAEADVVDPAAAPELAGMAAPADAWRDLAPAITSAFTLPAGEWLLPGTDADADVVDEEAGDDGEPAEGIEDTDEGDVLAEGVIVVEADPPREATPVVSADAATEAESEGTYGPEAGVVEADDGEQPQTVELDETTEANEANEATENAPEAVTEAVTEAKPEADAAAEVKQPAEVDEAAPVASAAAEEPAAETGAEADTPADGAVEPAKAPATLTARTGNGGRGGQGNPRGKGGKGGRNGKKGGR